MTLSLINIVVLFVINLIATSVVMYFAGFWKKTGELEAESVHDDSKHTKEVIRSAVGEARKELSKIRVAGYDPNVGDRRMTRMYELSKKLELTDKKLAKTFWIIMNNSKVWKTVADMPNKNPQAIKFLEKGRKGQNALIDTALSRCNELERNPFSQPKDQ